MTGCWPSKQENLEMTNSRNTIPLHQALCLLEALWTLASWWIHMDLVVWHSHMTKPSFDSSPIGTPSPLVQHESKDPSPPSKQGTPGTSDLVPSPSQAGQQVQQVSHSPGRQPPPPLVSQPVPIPGSMAPLQQLGGMYPTTTSPLLS